ncbi:uncharacterized protein LOC118267775 [Spodoptera frugiperda]|uniref:Uncharacterized protein LOC118267775 n=1 Tax=Spodoptera frugiperda TaxID=7108 RepID=A0A9R0DMH7_SPOFR|nr:uncharacterized protein LOC118267775 [Spodoptera frugiperda]
MFFQKIAPKSFLGKFTLQKGSLIVGSITLIISVICVISIAVEILYYKECKGCTSLVMHNAYSFSINAAIYCLFMFFVNLWFIWGVRNHKSSVVLSWVVVTGLWWGQSLVLVFVLLCMYITDTSLGWMIALAGALLAYVIMAYFILVAYGYWLTIRKITVVPPVTTVE